MFFYSYSLQDGPLHLLLVLAEWAQVVKSVCIKNDREGVYCFINKKEKLGAELTDFVLVLNTKEAVKTFSQVGNVTLGGNVSGKFFPTRNT
jgi:hypothetical protein